MCVTQSCPWVGLTHGLGWVGSGSTIFVCMGWIGSWVWNKKFAKNRCMYIMYVTFRWEVIILLCENLQFCASPHLRCMGFGLGMVWSWVHKFTCSGLGWVWVDEMDPWTTLAWLLLLASMHETGQPAFPWQGHEAESFLPGTTRNVCQASDGSLSPRHLIIISTLIFNIHTCLFADNYNIVKTIQYRMSCYRTENRAMPLHISIRVEFYNGIVQFFRHSTAFLYRPTSATAQMLK